MNIVREIIFYLNTVVAELENYNRDEKDIISNGSKQLQKLELLLVQNGNINKKLYLVTLVVRTYINGEHVNEKKIFSGYPGKFQTHEELKIQISDCLAKIE